MGCLLVKYNFFHQASTPSHLAAGYLSTAVIPLWMEQLHTRYELQTWHFPARA